MNLPLTSTYEEVHMLLQNTVVRDMFLLGSRDLRAE